jgi:protein O-GlcNAc transferase
MSFTFRAALIWCILQAVVPAQTTVATERIQVLKRAAALIAQHDLAASESALQILLKGTPNDPVALNLLGVIRVEQQKANEAESLFRRALSINPQIAGPHLNLARLYSQTRPLDSIAELKEALRIAPQDEQAKSLLLRIAKEASLGALHAGDKQKALAILMRAREAEPHDPELLYEFGMVARDAGLPKDAQSALEEALRRRPGYGEAMYALARVYLDENMAQSAEKEMRKYLSLKPDDATAQYGLGFILVAEEKLDEAKTAFEKSLALQPNQTESVFELGRIAQQTGRDSAASEDFKKVLARDPHHAGALTEVGAMEYRAAEYAKAKNDLERAIASAPGFQKAHYFYALTLRRLGEQKESERQFEISRSLQKTHTVEPRLADEPQ